MEIDDVLSSWVTQFVDRLTYLAYTHVRNQATAEDIVQESFIKAMKSLGQLRQVENPLPWLMRIVINECHATKRKSWCKRVLFMEKDNAILSAEDMYLARSQDRELYQAILSLDGKYRVPIILFYFEDLPVKDIALAMNLESGTVRTRLHRGRNQLMEILEGRYRRDGRSANSES